MVSPIRGAGLSRDIVGRAKSSFKVALTNDGTFKLGDSPDDGQQKLSKEQHTEMTTLY
jgi:hypothetical protein